MKRAILVAACVVGFCSSAWAQMPNSPQLPPDKTEVTTPVEYPDLPRGSWEYEVTSAMCKTSLIKGRLRAFNGTETMTRFEFAVIVARFLKAADLLQDGEVTQDTVSRLRLIIETKAQNLSPYLSAMALTDGIIALCREFSSEIGRLGPGAYKVLEERTPVFENRVSIVN